MLVLTTLQFSSLLQGLQTYCKGSGPLWSIKLNLRGHETIKGKMKQQRSVTMWHALSPYGHHGAPVLYFPHIKLFFFSISMLHLCSFAKYSQKCNLWDYCTRTWMLYFFITTVSNVCIINNWTTWVHYWLRQILSGAAGDFRVIVNKSRGAVEHVYDKVCLDLFQFMMEIAAKKCLLDLLRAFLIIIAAFAFCWCYFCFANMAHCTQYF